MLYIPVYGAIRSHHCDEFKTTLISEAAYQVAILVPTAATVDY
jgi:hypothetical protein